ncbi:DUF2306 domain-containing protein [Actinokineospora soli]|uniref:DUF2306 domain-containing protein n=1 Tax=Actinokineospora soli TaxID=1048753 RepID=A0ABW2TRV8_9PSEU
MTSRTQWRVPAALIALNLIPVGAGAFRTAQLVGGAEVTEANARFFAAPVPVLLHIVGASAFCVVGAFQFVPSLRGRSRWHRAAGRFLIPCGLVGALSGLWMAFAHPLPPEDGDLLAAFRLLFGGIMVAGLVLGYAAVRRRDFAAHRAWMLRAYAVAAARARRRWSTAVGWCWWARRASPGRPC